MRVSYYCQHVLGVGHLRRSLEICKALTKRYDTSLILGGPPVSSDTSDLRVLQLPGLRMDSEFNNLIPCDDHSLAFTKEQRQKLLYSHFETFSPHCFITELYPFGRKAFRFELDPVLSGIKEGKLPNCKCVCSVRDILVEKQEGREKFESRVVKTLNNYYDTILVHADPVVVTLDETFTPMGDITVPIHYTGFVSEQVSSQKNGAIRERLNLSKQQKLIVASAGGGGVGSDLLHAVLNAFSTLQKFEPEAHLQVFTGPYCTEQDYELMRQKASKNITINRFTRHFPDWLAAADLSISMAGYNTCMNLLQTGVPALVLPFQQNREQAFRVTKLGKQAPIKEFSQENLQPETLGTLMAEQLKLSRMKTPINLNGAEVSSALIDTLLKQ